MDKKLEKYLDKMIDRMEQIDERVDDKEKRKELYYKTTTPYNQWLDQEHQNKRAKEKKKPEGFNKASEDIETDEPSITDDQEEFLRKKLVQSEDEIEHFIKQCEKRNIKVYGNQKKTIRKLTKSQASQLIEEMRAFKGWDNK